MQDQIKFNHNTLLIVISFLSQKHIMHFNFWGIVSEPPRFTHYGETYKRVDMRAEVGRMTRNIHKTSEVAEAQTNGGHIKVN